MILVGLGAAILTIFAAGFGVTLSIFARTNRFNLVECACLSWLLGSGIISLLLWIGGTFCSGLVLQAVVTIACLAALRVARKAESGCEVPLLDTEESCRVGSCYNRCG